tara:strand:+ start:1893 stop:2249 length:357 start_codon:yes stop_codon:yes gene_type:complete
MLEDFVEEKNVNDDSLINDDIAIVLKPNFKNNKWNHTVDVNAIVMPQEKLKDIEQDELKDVMYALITCFNLLNTNTEFAKRVADEMDRISESDFNKIAKDKNKTLYNLSSWTKTVGNA